VSELDDQIEQALRDTAGHVAHDGPGQIDDVRARAHRIAGRRRATRVLAGSIAVLALVLGVAVVRTSMSRRADLASGIAFTAIERDGSSAEVPADWFVLPAAPTASNPALVYWIASRAVGTDAHCDDRGLTDASETQLRATDVIVQIRERRLDDRAPPSPPIADRPERLDASTMDVVEDCRNADARFYRIAFTDHGRQFDLILVVGDDAPAETVALGWEVLNRFAVR